MKSRVRWTREIKPSFHSFEYDEFVVFDTFVGIDFEAILIFNACIYFFDDFFCDLFVFLLLLFDHFSKNLFSFEYFS